MWSSVGPAGAGLPNSGIDDFLARDGQWRGHRTVPVGSTVRVPRGGRCRAEVLVRSRGTARKARRLGQRHRRPRHDRSRTRNHAAEVLHRPGQLPQQGRAGLQGQRRLPAAVRRPGDVDRHHDGAGPHGRRALRRHRPGPVHTLPRRPHEDRPGQRRRHPAHDPAVRRRARVEPERQPDDEHRREGAARRAGRGTAGIARGRGPDHGRARDAGAARRDPRGAAHARQPRVGQVPPLQQPEPDPARPEIGHPRPPACPDRHAAAGQPVDRVRGEGLRAGAAGGEEAAPAEHDEGHDGRVDPAQGPERLPAGRDVDARRHRRRDHDRDPARPVHGAMAPAPAARRTRRRGVGVRTRGLRRDPAHDRDDRRPSGDARHRDRLRDPDARARRGGSGHRPRPAPDPGDGAQSRAGPARRDVRRDLRASRRCTSPRCR